MWECHDLFRTRERERDSKMSKKLEFSDCHKMRQKICLKEVKNKFLLLIVSLLFKTWDYLGHILFILSYSAFDLEKYLFSVGKWLSLVVSAFAFNLKVGGLNFESCSRNKCLSETRRMKNSNSRQIGRWPRLNMVSVLIRTDLGTNLEVRARTLFSLYM